MTDKAKALIKAVEGGGVEVVKLIPGLGILIEGVRAYHESIEEQQREKFIQKILDRLSALEDSFSDEWYRTPEGLEVTKKIVASALNAEFADKIEYFTNALLNAPKGFEQAERLKFVEILRHISKPALEILATEKILQMERGKHFSEQVLVGDLIKKTRLSPHLVESCVNELYSMGVFSSTISFSKSGHPSAHFSEGIAAFTQFTERFIEFIKDPRSIS